MVLELFILLLVFSLSAAINGVVEKRNSGISLILLFVGWSTVLILSVLNIIPLYNDQVSINYFEISLNINESLLFFLFCLLSLINHFMREKKESAPFINIHTISLLFLSLIFVENYVVHLIVSELFFWIFCTKNSQGIEKNNFFHYLSFFVTSIFLFLSLSHPNVEDMNFYFLSNGLMALVVLYLFFRWMIFGLGLVQKPNLLHFFPLVALILFKIIDPLKVSLLKDFKLENSLIVYSFILTLVGIIFSLRKISSPQGKIILFNSLLLIYYLLGDINADYFFLCWSLANLLIVLWHCNLNADPKVFVKYLISLLSPLFCFFLIKSWSAEGTEFFTFKYVIAMLFCFVSLVLDFIPSNSTQIRREYDIN